MIMLVRDMSLLARQLLDFLKERAKTFTGFSRDTDDSIKSMVKTT